MGAILVIMFILFVALGVPISFALGVVSFTGIASLAQIPNTVVFSKMFNGLNSFTLLAVPLRLGIFECVGIHDLCRYFRFLSGRYSRRG